MLQNNKITDEQISAYLSQGFLIQYYDIEGMRLGIKSLSQKEIDEIFLKFRGDIQGTIKSSYETPSLFAKHFLYSLDSHILEKEEREALVDEISKGIVDNLFEKWNLLQKDLTRYKEALTQYTKTPFSKLQFKLCKILNTTPNSSIIQSMDPVVKDWFYNAILQDERDLLNEVYDKLEFLVGFFDSKAAKEARNHRLRAQGITPEGTLNTTNFDKELLEELAKSDPNFDPSQYDSWSDFLSSQNISTTTVQNSENVLQFDAPGITEEEKNNFLLYLQREKGEPLTDREKELAIYKLEEGQSVSIKQIMQEIEEESLPESAILDDFNLNDL